MATNSFQQNGVVGKKTEHWRQLGPPYPLNLDWLSLFANGEYAIGPMRFDQASRIRNSTYGSTSIEKPPGEGNPLVVRFSGGRILRFKFEFGHWFGSDVVF